MVSIGKGLIFIGLSLVLLGAAIYLAGRLGLPFGRLPGDIRIERENFSFHFPVATMIVLSILLTVGLNVLLRIMNRK